MKRVRVKAKFTGFVFGEGRTDKKFLIKLIGLEKFHYHTQKWKFNYGNFSGRSPKNILVACEKNIAGIAYDLVLCFIDLDKLKSDFGRDWELRKKKLENEHKRIKIIWQEDDLEGEMKKVLGNFNLKKKGINRLASNEIKKFINSELWTTILNCIKEKEKELET